MRLLRVISPTWLKVLLLIFGIMFILIGYYGLSENDSEFTFHFVSVLVEICIGSLFTYAILDEIIKGDKEERMSYILLAGDWQIANYSMFIIFMSLSRFPILANETDRKPILDILPRIGKPSVIPNSDILSAMQEGITWWNNLFFDEKTIEPNKDYPEIVLGIYEDINRYIKYIKKLSPRLEETAIKLEQIEAIYGFERAAELFEDSIEDFKNKKLINGKAVNLMAALNALLGVSVYLYAFSLAYHDSLPRSEVVEVHKLGFKFSIRKWKWWL